MEDILNGTRINEVADIDLASFVGMVKNADRETQNVLMGTLMELIRSSKRFTKI